MLHSLLAFALPAALVILAPGPDTLLILRNTARGGRRAGVLTSLGILSGLAVWIMAAAFGLSALLAASRLGYDILRFAGAAYLIWLGLAAFGMRLGRGNQEAEQPDPTGPLGLRATYLVGVLTNLLNPKVGVLFLAFLPAFVPAGATSLTFFALGGVFLAESIVWLGVLVWVADRAALWLRRATIRRRADRITGTIMIGFGIRLLAEA
ncbi:LysE family translocator [Nocardia panacis]|uniref:LysE family translocator n=1 Tax=Nocardia panacis TaxID=2340916 RepID=UPI001315616B|nr:LysE family translocator [Nocardia panacis]